jgi:hypothetical protein
MISNDDREFPSPPRDEQQPFEPMMHNDSFDPDTDEGARSRDEAVAAYRRRQVYSRLYAEHTYYPPQSATSAPPSIRVVHGQMEGTLSAPPPPAPPVRLERPPAQSLRALLALLMPRKAYERIIRPYFADEFHEYCEALRVGDRRRALVIVVRMHMMIWYNVVAAIVASVVRPIKELSR